MVIDCITWNLLASYKKSLFFFLFPFQPCTLWTRAAAGYRKSVFRISPQHSFNNPVPFSLGNFSHSRHKMLCPRRDSVIGALLFCLCVISWDSFISKHETSYRNHVDDSPLRIRYDLITQAFLIQLFICFNDISLWLEVSPLQDLYY